MYLTHPLDRKHQLSTAQQIIRSDAKFVIVRAPTGSGKTAYVAFAAEQGYRTLAAVRTKSLQAQYKDGYNFTSITGKADYICNDYGQKELFEQKSKTADLCAIPHNLRDVCRNNCAYPLARYKFVTSQAGILNYAKFLSDRLLIEHFSPNILFLDEAHQLSDIVIDFSGKNYSWNNRNLLKFASPYQSDDKMPQKIQRDTGKQWLQDFYNSLSNKPALHPSQGGDLHFYKWWERAREKADVILACMNIEPGCFYVKADDKKLTIKPKTAQYHFLSLFDKSPKIVLMSATIQPKDIEALGITDYEFITVPNTIKPQDRPIHNLGGPKVTGKMSLAEQKEHAQLIANAINKHPGWNGIIHTTSKRGSTVSTESLANDLDQLINNPIWTPNLDNGQSTIEAYQQWQHFNARYENAICIAWQFDTGIDMGDVAINITARVPYPYFGDEFERERFDYNPSQALVRVANVMEQQQGRNRRGFEEHYGLDAKKFNAIVDSKWSRLKSSMSKDFLDAIV